MHFRGEPRGDSDERRKGLSQSQAGLKGESGGCAATWQEHVKDRRVTMISRKRKKKVFDEI